MFVSGRVTGRWPLKINVSFGRLSFGDGLIFREGTRWWFTPLIGKKYPIRIYFKGVAVIHQSGFLLGTLPETNSKSTWKWMVGRLFSSLGWPIFSGYVSFRECNVLVIFSSHNGKTIFLNWIYQHNFATDYQQHLFSNKEGLARPDIYLMSPQLSSVVHDWSSLTEPYGSLIFGSQRVKC